MKSVISYTISIIERILDDIRDDVCDPNNMSRVHLLTKKELHNIMDEYHISFKERFDRNDVNSVEKLISEFNMQYSAVTTFKFNKERGKKGPSAMEEDFMMVIMSSLQVNVSISYVREKY